MMAPVRCTTKDPVQNRAPAPRSKVRSGGFGAVISTSVTRQPNVSTHGTRMCSRRQTAGIRGKTYPTGGLVNDTISKRRAQGLGIAVAIVMASSVGPADALALSGQTTTLAVLPL